MSKQPAGQPAQQSMSPKEAYEKAQQVLQNLLHDEASLEKEISSLRKMLEQKRENRLRQEGFVTAMSMMVQGEAQADSARPVNGTSPVPPDLPVPVPEQEQEAS